MTSKMEIIYDNDPQQPKRDVTLPRNIYLGTVFILAGLVWLLHNLEVFPHYLFSVLYSWQVLLILIGGYLVTVRRPVAGWIIGGLGTFFLAIDLFDLHIPIGDIVLPAACIALGVAILASRR